MKAIIVTVFITFFLTKASLEHWREQFQYEQAITLKKTELKVHLAVMTLFICTLNVHLTIRL